MRLVQLYVWIRRPTLEDAAHTLEELCAKLDRLVKIESASVSRTKTVDCTATIEMRGKGPVTYRRVLEALGTGWQSPFVRGANRPTLEDWAHASLSGGGTFTVAGVVGMDVSRNDELFDRARSTRQEQYTRSKLLALVPDLIKNELATKKLLDDFIDGYGDFHIGKYVAWVVSAGTPRDRFLRLMQMVREVDAGVTMMGKARPGFGWLRAERGFIVRTLVARGVVEHLRERPTAQRRAYFDWIKAAKTPAAQRKRLAKVIGELRGALFMGERLEVPSIHVRSYRVR